MRSSLPARRSAQSGAILVALSALLSPAFAAFYDVPGARVEAVLSARTDYDSNIFLNSNDASDFVSTFSGALKVVRDVALVKSDLSLGASASLYADHSDQKSFDPYLRGNFVYEPSDKTTVSGGFGYARNTMANETLNTRTKSDDLSLSGHMQSLFSDKLGYRLNGSYRQDKYHTTGYSDVLSYSAGADAVYTYSPKLTMVAGYTHRESWTENRVAGAGNPASKDSRYSAGLEGQLAPKVSGTISAGMVRRSFDKAGFDGSSAFFLSSGVKWVPAQKTSVAIDASQDFDTTAANQSSKVSSFSTSITQNIDEKWSVDGSVAYSRSNYQGASGFGNRRDNNLRLKTRVSYAFATNVNVEASLGYGNVDSTNTFSTYDRVSAGVGITASF